MFTIGDVVSWCKPRSILDSRRCPGVGETEMADFFTKKLKINGLLNAARQRCGSYQDWRLVRFVDGRFTPRCG
jgi:hypothetical protein